MRIAFLLGAGVSIPAGMPSTQDLTGAGLRVEDFTLHADGSFVRAAPQVLGDYSWRETQPLLKSLLQTVNDHCKDYFDVEKKSRVVNYEDLFFAASQLEEHLSEEYENPALEPFTKTVLNSVHPVHGRKELSELADMVCNYIRDVVAIELNRN